MSEVNVFEDVLPDDTEPADPEDIDHTARESTRIAPPDYDVSNLPRPLLKCGCGGCPDFVDPLADEDDVPDIDSDDGGVFSDVVDRRHLAADVCDNPRPVTVGRAGDIWKVYKASEYRTEGYTSVLDRTRNQYGKAMTVERSLLNSYDDATTVLFSFRVSPVTDASDTTSDTDDEGGGDPDAAYYDATRETPTQSDSERVWLSPLSLDARLREGWTAVRKSIHQQFGRYGDFAYLWVVGTTDSAATPHRHVLVWVDDPDDEVSALDVRPVVDRFVATTPGVEGDNHRVRDGESDAAVIDHDATRLDDMDDDVIVTILKDEDEDFEYNSAAISYILTQRTGWTLADVLGDGHADDVALQGAAIEWASPYDWIGSSRNIDLENGDYGG